MRRRNRSNRQTSDAERIAAAEREAKAFAAAGNTKAARAAKRRIKDIQFAAVLLAMAHRRRPVHPTHARQLQLAQNARCRAYPLILGHLVRPVPPHPTRREERAFARRSTVTKTLP